MQLNSQQQQAIRYIGGPLLVLAGAGSGKTRVITEKIAYLIQQCGIKASAIAAVTFTNKAAKEMQQRVAAMLPKQQTRGLKVATFHSLGLDIIRQELTLLGYKAGFSLFDEQDSRVLIRELTSKETSTTDSTEQLLQSQISHWKNALISPEQALAQAENAKQQHAALVYAAYQRHLAAYNAFDFDDLIWVPVQLFNNHPETLAKWQQRIRYLLVDEYQDTNASQYTLVKQLVGISNMLTVVGDDDQSIYAWRGARPENLSQLQQDFRQLKIIKLEQNYRSSGRILAAANQLIAANSHIFSKRLWSQLGYGDPIRIMAMADESKESQWLAHEIFNQRLRRSGLWSDYAVLYRGNYQARLLELELQGLQIPYQLSGGTSFFARAEIKDVMAYLRLLVNPDDDSAFLRIINTPRREIGPSTLEKLGQYASQRQISLLSASQELGLQQFLTGKPLARLNQFCGWLSGIKQACQTMDGIAIVRQLLSDIDYEDWLQQVSPNPKAAQKRWENVHYLLDNMAKLISEQAGDEESLQAAVSRLVLRDMLEQQADNQNGNQVQLLTLHAAKGLEFPHVYLMGMEEELLPHRTSIEEEFIEEERRLAYVGITRAQRTLTFTYAKKRKQYGEYHETTPSRFLAELPADDLSWHGHQQVSSEAAQASGKQHLAQLKALLAAD